MPFLHKKCCAKRNKKDDKPLQGSIFLADEENGSFQLQDKFNVLGKCLATWRCTRYNARVIDLERGCEDGTSRRNWQYPYQFGQL